MDNKDFTQYSTKCSQIFNNIFQIMPRFVASNNNIEKDRQNLADQMKDLELLLDQCYVDVEETVINITKNKKEALNRNNNYRNRNEAENNSSNSTLSLNDCESEKELIRDLRNKLKNTKLIL